MDTDEEIDEEVDEEEEFNRANDTELQNHEYFRACVDSAKKIGSITLDLSRRVEFGELTSEDYIYLANQLKDSNIENINLVNFLLDDDGLTAISAVLKHTKIKNINLASNKFGMDGFLALLSALGESKIEDLNLSCNQSIGVGIPNLADTLPSSNVTSLNLGFIDINFSCLKHLSNALPNTKITVLNLSYCQLNDMSIEYLSTKLSSSKIKSLNLAKNTMSFDSLKSLADVLENTAIAELNISNTQIDSTGAQYLAAKLSKSFLQNLDIGWNLIQSAGCLAIGNVIHLTQIIKLNLERNSIDSSGITSLAENLKKSNLKHLNLNRNKLQINGAQILANGMKDSKLEYLNVDNNQLSNVGMGMILDALQFTEITDFDLDCRDNDIKEENMEMITNAFKCFKLKNLSLTLPRIISIVGVFYIELEKLIESNRLDEILAIKNKMNFMPNFDFVFFNLDVDYILDVIKYFHMKKLIFNDYYIDDIYPVLAIVEMLMDVSNPISNITTLDLTGNSIGDEGAVIIAECLKYLKVTRLDLDDTEIENVGIIAITNELVNSKIRYLNIANNSFDSEAASNLTKVVEKHPVRIELKCHTQNGFSSEEQRVIKNINYMFLKAQLLVSSVSDNSPVKYDKDLMEYIKAYEIFKNVDLLWESTYGEPKYNYDRINSEIRSKVTRNFLKIIGVVNSDVINSNLLPTEIIIMICSYLNINDIKFD